jgi:poly(A) polymerase
MTMTIDLRVFNTHPAWDALLKVHKVLRSRGHKSYLAGGAVRDGILGRTPKDFDIATDALPNEVESYFQKTIDVGKAFGVIVVNEGGVNIEVTTFRKDGEYLNGRHPTKIDFTDEKEDALRRDFTVNALFFDLDRGQVVDFVDGEADVKRGLIRAVGPAVERFREDHLRPLRAIRFAAELDFEIEEKTWSAALLFRNAVPKVSRERISDELRKIMLAQNPLRGLLLLKESLFLQEIWPSLTLLQSQHYSQLTMKAFHFLAGDKRLELFLATLLIFEVEFETEHVGMNFRVGIERQTKALQEFRFPRNAVKATQFCLRNFLEMSTLSTRALLLLEDPFGLDLFDVLRVHRQARGLDLTALEKFKNRYLELCAERGQLPEALITGDDLENLLVKPGPIYSELIDRAYLEQLDGRLENKTKALDWLREKLS